MHICIRQWLCGAQRLCTRLPPSLCSDWASDSEWLRYATKRLLQHYRTKLDWARLGRQCLRRHLSSASTTLALWNDDTFCNLRREDSRWRHYSMIDPRLRSGISCEFSCHCLARILCALMAFFLVPESSLSALCSFFQLAIAADKTGARSYFSVRQLYLLTEASRRQSMAT